MTTPPDLGAILAAPSDPIRIVPLYVPEPAPSRALDGVPPAPPPRLTYRGGHLLDSVEVFTIFWGVAWQQAPQSEILSSLTSFWPFILASPLLAQLAEYNVPGHTIGPGRHTGVVTLTKPTLRHSVSDHAIQHMLQQEIATNPAFPHPASNTLYFIYLPPGVAVVQGGGRSCQAFCGYHNAISSQIFYAVMPYPGCAGCTASLSVLDSLTSTSSHELCEAITDPVPGGIWYDDVHGEIGDICAWKTKQLGAYTIQLEWSNQANSCV